MEVLNEARVGAHFFKNRLVRAATWEAKADEKGHMTEKLFAVYEKLAKGGIGAIITGYAFVTEEEQPNPGMMGIYNDSFIEEYQKLTSMVHEENAKIFLQIAYGGPNSGLNPPSEKIFGPSAVPNQMTGITPIEMTKADIEYITQAFVDAAVRAEKAGFDGVEFHMAHGYLLSLFLSPMFNQRSDEYGGTIENRARMLIDIVARARKVVGKDFLLLAKINSEDFIPEMDGGGLSSDESIEVVKMLEKVGLNMIEVSGGSPACAFVAKNNLIPARGNLTKETESYFAEHARKLVQSVNIPVILTGGNRTLSHLESLYKEDHIDFFAFSRALLCQPNLVNIWNKDPHAEPICRSCNGCFRTKDGKHCVWDKKNNTAL